MKKINLFNVSFCVLFCLISCQKNSEPKGTVASNSKSFDQTSNWVVLSKSDAVKKGRNYSWSFKTKHPVQYVVQIVFDKIPVQSKKVTLKMDSQKISSFIKQSYLTANKKVVGEDKYNDEVGNLLKLKSIFTDLLANSKGSFIQNEVK